MKSIAVVLCACSPLPLARLMLLLMPGTSMVVTMDMAMLLAMPTMDTMDTHMPTTLDTTMARGLLMLSPLLLPSPRLMLMLSTDTTDTLLPMPTMDMDMPTMDTMDTHMPTMDTTMARGPLMPSPPLMLMLTTDMDIPTTDTDMPTMDTTDTHMPVVDTSTDKMDIIIKFLVTKI